MRTSIDRGLNLVKQRSAFSFGYKQANNEIYVRFNNVHVNHNFILKYLGITLNQILYFKKTFRKYLSLVKKVKLCVNLI